MQPTAIVPKYAATHLGLLEAKMAHAVAGGCPFSDNQRPIDSAMKRSR
jgi:hypothetical protein